jgi:hypothetical protein
LTKCASKFLTVRDTDLGVEFEALNHTAFILAAILSATGLYGQRFTPQEAIAAARSNAKSGSSFTVLWEAVANADTRRIADQALEQAQARKIELLEDGLFANILRSGGFLIAETNPQTKEVIAQHLVLLEPGGAPRDLKTESASVVKLSDAVELVKDTAELVERLYSTPSTEDSFLARRFYGGSFPEGDQSLFAIPNSLRKLGANPNEVQEAAALYGGYLFWGWRYALSMPAFAASPVPALSAAGYKQEKLTAEFLRSNHMDPNFHLGLDNVQSEKQLKERIELLTRLDNFLEEALKNEGDPTVVRANLSLVTMPLGVEVNSSRDEGHYGSSTPSVLVFFWDRLATGGFVVKTITGGD